MIYLCQTVSPFFRPSAKSEEQRGYALGIEKPGVAAKICIDTLRIVATAALARVFPIALDFPLAACLARTPNSLTFIHGWPMSG